MDIEEISKKIYEFQKERFKELGPGLTPELMFTHLSEEIGEIARQIFNKNIPMREYDVDNLKEEISQSILDLLVLAKLFDIDLPKALDEKIEDIKKKKTGH